MALTHGGSVSAMGEVPQQLPTCADIRVFIGRRLLPAGRPQREGVGMAVGA